MTDSITIVGGTGQEGFGLALRWAHAGAHVRIGSRNRDRAAEACERLAQLVPQARLEAHLNAEAVERASLVVVTVPLAAQIETLQSIRDSLRSAAVVVDATVPLEKAIGGRLSQILPLWEGSAAERARRCLGSNVRVTAAFHCLSASLLGDLTQPVDSDVLVAGDDAEARALVCRWAGKIAGARAVDIGALENARYAEHLAALLISLNLRHRVKSSGVRFRGLPALGEGPR